MSRGVGLCCCLFLLSFPTVFAQVPRDYAKSFSPVEMFVLTAEAILTPSASLTLRLSLKASGEGVLLFGVRTETAWKNKESIVLRIFLDGKLQGHVVIFGKTKTPITYTTQVGSLEDGKDYTVSIECDTELSTVFWPELTLRDVSVLNFVPHHPLFAVLQHPPILYGRRGMNFNDTPLLMYHTRRVEGDRTVIDYQCIYANENGGTGTRSNLLMASWGRTTDIELVSRVILRSRPAAELLQEDFFQARGHEVEAFAGAKVDQHPLLQVVTDNNMLAPYQPEGYRLYLSENNTVDTLQGTQDVRKGYEGSYLSPRGYLSGYVRTKVADRFKFFFAPLPTLSEAGSRERLLDRYPWMYEIMAQELEQEKKLELVPSLATESLSDPRNYFYVEFQGQQSPPRLGREERASLFIGIKVGEKYYYSNHKKLRRSFRNITGSRRTAVELPPQLQAKDISNVIVCLAYGGTAYQVNRFRITKAFWLDERYRPVDSLPGGLRNSDISLSSPDDPNKIRSVGDFQAFCTSLVAP